MKKILIIEDDIVLRGNTADFIKEQNFEVFLAKDGVSGIQQTLKHLPDIILCDITMPNMNGYEFYETIKNIKKTSTIPLIFFSARTENKDIRAGMQLGADDYITKPFDLFELLKIIKTRLAKYDKIEQISNDEFHALIDHPTLAIFIYQNGKFLFYNNPLANIFGYNYKDFSSISLNELLDEKNCNKDKILQEIENCLKKEKGSISIKFKATQKSLKPVFIELFASVITYKGKTSLAGNIFKLDPKHEITNRLNETMETKHKLSNRELEVLELICNGKSTSDVAGILFLGQRTVETYRANLLEKTKSKNIVELIMYAIKNKLILIN
ncbi:hypothetical protein BTO04_12345 [Polaribacter sp. SA4-10]|uniref:response regulator n=1 Tax=Polaribacter sp. SA4-10 TaxID=754397 RepID=UPI000B3BFC47|nr:response regulator [Polaribacter sp. SA4-10]ARV07430.1 hypothetical protein BTO04_12345 [Polaribacter sp. SA4-10]